jgi:dipeptidyl aminopeptidase/acylaminoacyl peptidase
MTQTTQRAMTPQDLTRIRFVSDPQISPDGRCVAFVVTMLDAERDEYHANIWMVDTASGPPRRFTTGSGRDTTPRWSPDGQHLAFVAARTPQQKPQLYVMPAHGGEPMPLTNLRHGVAEPVWSPDSTRLAFVSRVGGWQAPEQAGEQRQSKPARVITTLKYKANGEGFIYDRPQQIFVVAAVGGEPQQVTQGDFVNTDPAWSPDGQWLAFVSARHDQHDDDNATDIWVVTPEGGTPRQITDTAGPLSLPVFAPDGQQLAYLGHRHRNEYGRHTRLFTVPVSGGPSVCLTAQLDRNCASFFQRVVPLWSPDGTSVLLVVETQGDVAVYRLACHGETAPTCLLGGERQITGLSVDRDSRLLAFTATTPTMPAEVFVCQADGCGERQLTALNHEWRATVALAQPQRLRYTRAGYELDCWVMRPSGYTPGQRYPALLNIHGGPHTQYGSGFFDEFQVYAGAGYAVIYTNPRGSQGYSEAFARAVLGDWGGGDYADVMAGLEEALRCCDFIDPQRLGILGGSYGGFLTSWAIGHTQRFRAACSERAVNNPYTLFGTSDIGHLFSEAESGALPWEKMQWYIDHAPLTYTPNITTPLLILHAEDDLRCLMEQAEQLYTALKKQRKEVMLVRFPDENHEMSRSGTPRHRLERFQFILEWFAKYLQH